MGSQCIYYPPPFWNYIPALVCLSPILSLRETHTQRYWARFLYTSLPSFPQDTCARNSSRIRNSHNRILHNFPLKKGSPAANELRFSDRESNSTVRKEASIELCQCSFADHIGKNDLFNDLPTVFVPVRVCPRRPDFSLSKLWTTKSLYTKSIRKISAKYFQILSKLIFIFSAVEL